MCNGPFKTLVVLGESNVQGGGWLAKEDERWADVLAYYATLPYFDRDPVDEFVMLAEQLIDISTGASVALAQAELDQAYALIDKGLRRAAAPHVVKAYELLYF